MSREMLLKTLMGLGLKETDAEIYILLSEQGPRTSRELADALQLYKQQLYRSLKRLQKNNIIIFTPGKPASFSAMPLESILDHWIELKREQALILKKSRNQLLSNWKTIARKEKDS